MIDRISKNEERLDSILLNLKNLEIYLNEFKKNKNNLRLLNKYYGSKNWFKDKELYENNKIEHIKAGVLSEDTVWNLNDDIKDLLDCMENIIQEYKSVL